MRGIIAALLAAVLGGVPAAAQTYHDDHERARRLVQAGEIVPLAEVLDLVARTVQGKMLEVELQNWDGRWIYDVRLLTPSGWIIDLFYDAKTKKLVETWGAGQPRRIE